MNHDHEREKGGAFLFTKMETTRLILDLKGALLGTLAVLGLMGMAARMAAWGGTWGTVFSRMCNRISMRPTTIMVDICRSKPKKWPFLDSLCWDYNELLEGIPIVQPVISWKVL